MVSDAISSNAIDLEKDLVWFSQILDARLLAYFPQDDETLADPKKFVLDLEPPDFPQSSSRYAAFINEHDFSIAERLAVILTLIPHIRPRLLDVFFSKNAKFDRPFSEFGGSWCDKGPFLPTVQTFVFIAAADDLACRIASLSFLQSPDQKIFKSGLIERLIYSEDSMTSFLESKLEVTPEILKQFTTGEKWTPEFNSGFPAQKITTELDWDDLVLDPETEEQLEEVLAWTQHGSKLLKDRHLSRKLRPGFRCLFYGYPGTGKTMTACLLGRYADKDVYRVDLSQVVSKYIGETEKNLSRLFDRAENKDWILFFDEADALFGKRTQTKDAHDRYANQEVAYLLQKIERFAGIVILGTNLKGNLDPAFIRRFESIINFPMPGPRQRYLLWKQSFSKDSDLGQIDLNSLANDHEFSGASIMNIVRDCSLSAVRKNSQTIEKNDVIQAIKKEMLKEQLIH